MEDTKKSSEEGSEGESLEGTGVAAQPAEGDDVALAPGEAPKSPKPGKTKKKFSLKSLWARINVYLLIFFFLVIMIIIAVVLIYAKSNNPVTSSTNKIPSQNLSASALEQLANSGTTIGDAKHILNVQSNTVFQGTVLVRGNLQVAGAVQIGNTLALTGLTVSGQSSFGQLQAKGLTVAGNESVQGQLTAGSLSVAGGGSFNGAVTAPVLVANSLQLNGDLGITHHIDTGGGVPGTSRGSALGGGGTASVSGSDSAGTISLHTGTGTVSGCFVTVFFTNSFGGTPHVVVTPVGIGGSTLHYYVTRSSSNFSVCTSNAASPGTSFDFDYVVLG